MVPITRPTNVLGAILLVWLGFWGMEPLSATDSPLAIVDSLYRVARATEGEEARIRAYRDAGLEAIFTQHERTETILTELAELYQATGNPLARAVELELRAEHRYELAEDDHYLDGYTDAVAWYLRSGDTTSAVDFLSNATSAYTSVGATGTAENLAGRIDSLGAATGRAYHRAVGHLAWARMLAWEGAVEDARARLEKGIEVLEGTDHHNLTIQMLIEQFLALRDTDREAARGVLERAGEIAQRTNDVEELHFVRICQMDIALKENDYLRAITLGNEVMEGSTIVRDRDNAATVTMLLGSAYADIRDYDTARALGRRGLELNAGSDYAREVEFHLLLARSSVGLKNYAAAETHFQRALEIADEYEDPFSQLMARTGYIDLLLDRNRISEARTQMALITPDMVEIDVVQEIEYDLVSARYALATKDYANATRRARSAETAAGELREVQLQTQAREILAEVYAATGKHPAAYAQLSALRTAEAEELELVQQTLRALLTKQFETTAERDRQLAAAERERDVAVLRAATTRTRWVASAVGLLALLGFAFFWQARRSNRTIRRANEQLDRANRTKDRIFAILGHDLRKPVLSFRNIGEKVNFLIQEGDFELLKKLGVQIERNAHGLQRLTDNLLNWALQQRDVLPHQPKLLNLRPVMLEVRDLFAGMAAEKGVTLQLDVAADETVLADPQTLPAILRNLVDNALKFTPTGGAVTLGAARAEDGRMRLFVRDTGVGIAEEKLPDLFLLNETKSERGTEGERGTGLGLHLVHGLVKLHRGDLRVRSTVGKGSEFMVLLPAVR